MAEPDPRTARSGSTTLRILPAIAFLGLVPILVGLFALTRTVTTPLQRCGTVGAFLLEGRPALRVNPADPPDGVTAEAIRDHQQHPCQERAANRARPAAVAIVSGLIVIGITALTETMVRWRLRIMRRRRAEVPEQDITG